MHDVIELNMSLKAYVRRKTGICHVVVLFLYEYFLLQKELVSQTVSRAPFASAMDEMLLIACM